MPNSLQRRSRWAFVVGALLGQLALIGVVGIFVLLLRNDVGGLQADARTSEVATCYAQARGRPSLIVIFRVLAGVATDSTDRDVITALVDTYESATPTLNECDKLARTRGLDPADFPAPEVPRERTARRTADANTTTGR